MKLKIIVLIVMCAFFSRVKSQENTTYFFMGNVFSVDEKGDEVRHPYLPVLLAYKDKPEDVVAVRLTNMVGVFSFEDVPINIYKDYILSFPLPNGERKFLFEKEIKEPEFKGGNFNTHIKFDGGVVNTSIKKLNEWRKGRKK